MLGEAGDHFTRADVYNRLGEAQLLRDDPEEAEKSFAASIATPGVIPYGSVPARQLICQAVREMQMNQNSAVLTLHSSLEIDESAAAHD